jgi:hypothetical protein
MSLIRLPNGNWIHPEAVRQIVVLPDIELTFGGFAPPRVRVDTVDGGYRLIECADLFTANMMRDKIAEQVNGHQPIAAMGKILIE